MHLWTSAKHTNPIRADYADFTILLFLASYYAVLEYIVQIDTESNKKRV